jgi:hypothetical protein
MDTPDVAVPACIQTAKAELLDSMGMLIPAFGAEQAVRDLIGQAKTHYNNFAAYLATVNESMPPCVPLLTWRLPNGITASARKN